MVLRALFLVLFLAAAVAVHAGSVQLLDGTTLEGELSFDNGLVVRSDKTARVPISSILRATFGEAKAEEFQPGLVLVNGTRIAGIFSSLAETTVKFEGTALAIPGGEVAWAVYAPFSAASAAQVPAGKLGALLPGGDFFEGAPKGADASTAKVLNPIFGPRAFDARKKEIQALILREPKPQPAAFEVVTANGSVFAALDLVVRDNTGVFLRHPLYDGLRVELKDLVEIRAGSARVVALDTLKPARVDTPAGRTPEQSFSAGKGLDGAPLLAAGKAARGLESGAGTVITWDLPANASVFMARVAASAATPAAQKLVFAVYADGKPLGRSNPSGSGDAPAILRCTIPAGAKLLSIRAEGLAGSGVWAEPLVLRR